jgi:serine/threonine protein kinase
LGGSLATGHVEGGRDTDDEPASRVKRRVHEVVRKNRLQQVRTQRVPHPSDRQTDFLGKLSIWAFGVVLYEMLTGRRAFEGDDVSTIPAAVLTRDPEWSSLPGDTPGAQTPDRALSGP